jgi:hypothetical protein
MIDPAPSPAERVAAGAAHLDRLCPGWAHLVDPDSLDMSLSGWCVLGQVFGNFWTAIREIFPALDDVEASRLAAQEGFQADGWKNDDDYHRLRDAWLAEIAARTA